MRIPLNPRYIMIIKWHATTITQNVDGMFTQYSRRRNIKPTTNRCVTLIVFQNAFVGKRYKTRSYIKKRIKKQVLIAGAMNCVCAMDIIRNTIETTSFVFILYDLDVFLDMSQ